jgi:hypothetical protein
MKKAIYILILFVFFKLLLKEAYIKPISRTDNYAEGWLIKIRKWITGFIMKMEIKKEEGHYEDNKNVNGGFFMNQIKKLIKKVSLKTTN